MDKDEWIIEAKKLLKCIRFNKLHQSYQREIVGGVELDKINELLGINN